MRSARGDRRAFDALIRRHYGAVYRSAWRRCGDPEDAANLTQEVFLAAAGGIRGYRGLAPFRGWLMGILFRLDRSRVRARTRESLAQAAGDPDGLPSMSGDPEAEAIRREQSSAVREALDRLPGVYRTVLLLREWEGLSYREIGRVLGCSVGTVESRLWRARQTLRDSLKGRIFAGEKGVLGRQTPDRKGARRGGLEPLPSALLQPSQGLP